MPLDPSIKIKSVSHLYEVLPESERITVDVLRQIIIAHTPATCKEKISFNVPYFYGNKGICIVYPSFIPRGGIKKGVLLGFWYGRLLKDADNYLTHGTNKQIFYKIFDSVEEIDEKAIVKLLKEAVGLDKKWLTEIKKKSLNPSYRLVMMTPNETIYFINQNAELLKAWRELSESQKRAVIKACETAEESDIERIIVEVVHGQRRLF